ncbi:isoliquiritigenin 2'-O-methyltransferase-like [Senna tora]|uniref:Isoliquiritigenin 2'-O-methyltransferase-like n=1 Tax=Senna tora TaxID=362788 RepID=A0A835CEP9_9FABA|nr:isoliquiritigenin 2'-O-methyltransferase-like [Senna tora]
MELNAKEKHSESTKDDDSFMVSAMNVFTGQIVSAALNAAIELNLFEIIAKADGRHVSVTEIASQLPKLTSHEIVTSKLDRLLRLLVTHSLLTCSYVANQGDDTQRQRGRERLYAISPIGKFFVSGHHNNNGEYLGFSSLLLAHPTFADAWLNFKNAIIDEEDTNLFKKVHGLPLYQYSNKDPKLGNLFNKAMEDLSFIWMKRILEIYKGFEGISTLVDVGGGNAQTLKMILSKYPSIKAINFDLPHVIQNAPPHPGIEHVGGDMFASVPKGDAIILKNICHNWSDESSIKILRKCYDSLPENGKVIVLEFIMPEEVEQSEEAKLISTVDSTMFLHGGRARSEKEFESLSKQSGFSAFKLACHAFNIHGVIEFYK